MHVEAERFTREKYETLNPILVFCSLFPDRIEDFRCVAVEESDIAVAPFLRELAKLKGMHGDDAYKHLKGNLPYTYAGSERPSGAAVSADTATVTAFLRHLSRKEVSFFFCGHHASHAANAFYSSGYSDALVITLDGIGYDYKLDAARRTFSRDADAFPTHRMHGSVFECSGLDCVPIYQETEWSLGFAWARVTEHVFDLGVGEEGTVMAMAAYGDLGLHRHLFEDSLIWLPTPDGDLAPDMRLQLQSRIEDLRRRLGADQDRFDVAAALQAETERRFQAFLSRFIQPFHRRVCLAGGAILNCQMVGKIRTWFPQLEQVFIPPAPYDGGICIGAAQLTYHNALRGQRPAWEEGLAPFATGSTYSRLEIVAACRSLRLPVGDSNDGQLLDLLSSGKLVGLFSGAAESGRRALGQRSILADPRRAEAKAILNEKIKHRQSFRPFAPMVLAEDVADWFECTPNFESPYMSFAVKVRPDVKSQIPAVVHFDGTARVQTVHAHLSPHLHAILSRWKALTGVPVLLNTSFNDREPIVQTPADALNTMLRAGLDAVYFADEALLVTPMPMKI